MPAEHGGKLVETQVAADPLVVAAPGMALAHVAQQAQFVSDGDVVRDDHAAFAGRHDLRGEERECAGDAKCTSVCAVQGAPVRVGTVLDDDCTRVLGELADLL